MGGAALILAAPTHRKNRQYQQDSRYPYDEQADDDPNLKPFHGISSQSLVLSVFFSVKKQAVAQRYPFKQGLTTRKEP